MAEVIWTECQKDKQISAWPVREKETLNQGKRQCFPSKELQKKYSFLRELQVIE